MRTTVELDDAHRARLLALAARRREKGFSRIVREALDAYLDAEARADKARRRALRLRGTLGRKAAEDLRAATGALRRSWR